MTGRSSEELRVSPWGVGPCGAELHLRSLEPPEWATRGASPPTKQHYLLTCATGRFRECLGCLGPMLNDRSFRDQPNPPPGREVSPLDSLDLPEADPTLPGLQCSFHLKDCMFTLIAVGHDSFRADSAPRLRNPCAQIDLAWPRTPSSTSAVRVGSNRRLNHQPPVLVLQDTLSDVCRGTGGPVCVLVADTLNEKEMGREHALEGNTRMA